MITVLRAIAGNLAALARSRLELFAVEVQEEKTRTLRLLAWTCAAMLTGGMAFLLLNLAIVLLVAESWRVVAALLLALLYAAGFAVILSAIRRRLRQEEMPFSRTIGEFLKDKECLTRDD